MTPTPQSRRIRSTFWLGALLVLAVLVGSAWLAGSLSDRSLITAPAMDPSLPSMPGIDHENMPGVE